ncbi:Zn(II)2Cys6 transcription factor domain-containing protein [Aspergillus affinis]|uniref:Zn(II)2Cys6 transcription factor domain-containing protein n=1 Tax=Aspergillus affinis TaxID=1070780 RepID=UPI0022FDD1C9|nr:uncharacterized protein KD926_007407 [Aspergillus affinis]KAI9041137.1 hypothetical protein KD926_007407 [Aspergillus affinis]
MTAMVVAEFYRFRVQFHRYDLADTNEVICDEAKPQCGHCLRHSIVCDYSLQAQTQSRVQGEAPRGDSQESIASDSASSGLENQYRFISASTTNFKPPKRKHKRQSQLYDTVTLSTAISESSCTTIPERPFQFSGADMELFHHYMTSTSMTLAEDEAGRQMMQSTLPQLGFKFNHVLRLLLAFSGYHIAHLKRQQQKQQEQELVSLQESPDESIITQADRHYTIALSQVSTSISTLNETTCHAMYASAVFICFCSFAKGPQVGQYLGFSETGNAEWMTLLGGVRSIVQYSRDTLSVDLIPSDNSNLTLDQHLHEPSEDQGRHDSGWKSCLQQLREVLIQELPVTESRHPIYLGVLDGLASSFNKVYGAGSLSRGDKWAQIFRWLYTLPAVFSSDLQEHTPLALLLFSPFVVLLKELDSYCMIPAIGVIACARVLEVQSPVQSTCHAVGVWEKGLNSNVTRQSVHWRPYGMGVAVANL